MVLAHELDLLSMTGMVRMGLLLLV